MPAFLLEDANIVYGHSWSLIISRIYTREHVHMYTTLTRYGKGRGCSRPACEPAREHASIMGSKMFVYGCKQRGIRVSLLHMTVTCTQQHVVFYSCNVNLSFSQMSTLYFPLPRGMLEKLKERRICIYLLVSNDKKYRTTRCRWRKL